MQKNLKNHINLEYSAFADNNHNIIIIIIVFQQEQWTTVRAVHHRHLSNPAVPYRTILTSSRLSIDSSVHSTAATAPTTLLDTWHQVCKNIDKLQNLIQRQ